MKPGLPKSSGGAPIKLTPITGRVSRAKKGIPVHVCDICQPPKVYNFLTILSEAHFTRAEHLRRHQLSHGPFNYVCPVHGCGKGFHQEDLLRRHIQRHEQAQALQAQALPSSDQPQKTLSQNPVWPRPQTHFSSVYWRSSEDYTTGLQNNSSIQSVAPTPSPLMKGPITTSNILSSTPETTHQRSSVLSKRGASVYTDSAFTDSGYASLRSGPSNNTRGNVDHQALLTPGYTFTGNDNISIGYSEALSLRSTRLDTVIFEIAQEISSLLPQSITQGQHALIASNLPGLLEYFAMRISTEAPQDLCRRLMYLVHKYKDQIATSITDLYENEEENAKATVPFQDDSMPLDDKLQLWASKADVHTSAWPEQDDWGKDPEASEEEHQLPELQEYSDLLLRSPAYYWLQKSLDSILRTTTPGTINARKDIQALVLASFPNVSHLSLKSGPALHIVAFTSPWILGFLESQDYQVPLYEALPKVLVLAGTRTAAWATTCEQYIKTVWPTFGLVILDIYVKLLKSPREHQNTYFQSVSTELDVDLSPDCQTLTAEITGLTHSIVEVVEILTWFESLRHHQIGVAAVTPGCTVDTSENKVSPKSEVQFSPHEGSCDPEKEGQCWLGLFDTPVLVRGFPVPFRDEELHGIEMSLEMLPLLANSQKISKFAGKILIKGFAAALVPTKKTEDYIMWHVVVNSTGDHLSYTDPRIRRCLAAYPEDLAVGDLASARHIVGWSSNVKSNTGSSKANYDVKWSGLERPKAGCAFEKVTIVGGMFVTAGISCILGKKDKAVHIRTRDDYTMRLKWISKKFVVLYDVAEKRAWLVDGASALLHLVRASLKRDSDDLFSSQFLYKESSLVEAPPDFNGKRASVFVLTHPDNMSLPLYAKPAAARHETNIGHSGAQSSVTTHTKTYYCLKDRIESIYEVLEQIIAHQADVASEDGVGFRVKHTIRQQLEGFDFMDIATDEDPLWPRTTSLQPRGRGWVDFIRAIHAITLFGTGFGELIQPTRTESDTSCEKCNLNISVPKMADYLTVCISDLREILQKQGAKTTNPWRLVDNIYWHAPDPPFDPCRCDSALGSSSPSPNRVQVLLPATFPRFWRGGMCSPDDLNFPHYGAVLFGYSSRFPLRWGALGDPELSPLVDSIETLDPFAPERTLGTSSGTSSTLDEHSTTSTSLGTRTGATEISSTSEDSNEEPARKRSKIFKDWLKRG